jgi:hydroxyacylglutathione hydrolase
MIVETFPVGLLQCNCTILGDEETRGAIVVDPGDDADAIMSRLENHGLELKRIVCTHAHIDHVGAIYDLQERADSPASIHEKDLFLFDNLKTQAEWIGMPSPKRGEIDRFVDDGDSVECPNVILGVIHTPGHTPGSLTLHLGTESPILFTGDTLFLNSIGRTDLWGGSLPDLLGSIKGRLLEFDDDTLVVPGHGPNTTIGRERAQNPFLR